jgi:hypothetical protein
VAGELGAWLPLAHLWGQMRVAICFGSSLMRLSVVTGQRFMFPETLARNVDVTIICLQGSARLNYSAARLNGMSLTPGAVLRLGATQNWNLTSEEGFKMLVTTSRRIVETHPDQRAHPDPFMYPNGALL